MYRVSLRLLSSQTFGTKYLAFAVLSLILVTGCSRNQEITTGHALHAVIGQQLVALDSSHGVAAELLTSPQINDLGALTYAADCDCFYAVVDSTQRPTLVRLDRRSGEIKKITPLRLPDLAMNRVEALAWNPQENLLYAAGGVSAFASNRLFSVDPQTRRIRDLGPIKGTTQNEADALAFAQGRLLAIDSAAQMSQLFSFELLPERVRARPLGQPFAGTVTDMEFDPERSLLLAVEGSTGRLLTLNLEGIPQATQDGETEIGMSALAMVHNRHLVPTQIFADGFESGTLSLWSDQESKH